jgi:thioesterase domain-containing protein
LGGCVNNPQKSGNSSLEKMKSYRVLTLILLGATSFACTGHSNEAEGWTKEDLAELEAKWGQNVSIYNRVTGQVTHFDILIPSTLSRGSAHLPI